MMSTPVSNRPGSVSRAIHDCRAGDRDVAAGLLWARFGEQMTEFVRRLMRREYRRLYDAEDIVNSGFAQVIISLWQGELDQVRDRIDLWRLLIAVLRRKNASAEAFFSRVKRRPRRLLGESDFGSGPALDRMLPPADYQPTEEEIALLNREFAGLLDSIGNHQSQAMAVMRIAGVPIDEIARQVGCSPRTVARRLAEVRAIWASQRRRD